MYYLLKEFVFIIFSKEIFRIDKVIVVYYCSWFVYEKFVNGDYDGELKKGLGLVIIKYN